VGYSSPDLSLPLLANNQEILDRCPGRQFASVENMLPSDYFP